MAAGVCSEISSPRISFSHDLKDTHESTSRSDAFLLNSTIDFDFYINQYSQEISSADEIFADGKILAVEIEKQTPHKKSHEPQNNIEDSNENTKKKRLIEFLSTSFDEEEEEEETEQEKTEQKTEQLRSSSSLNCDSGKNTNKLLRSLQFLTRSNSTGSALPTQKQVSIPKGLNKQHSLKESSFQYYKSTPNRPYLKKSTSSKMYGNGVRVSPVLNIPPTYIAKGTVGLFGIASLFCTKKSKKKKK